jgi:hypothetical protein
VTGLMSGFGFKNYDLDSQNIEQLAGMLFGLRNILCSGGDECEHGQD